MELTDEEIKMIQMRRRAREAGMMPQPQQQQKAAVEEPPPPRPRPVDAPREFISDTVRTAVCLWLVIAMIYCIVAAVALPWLGLSVSVYWWGLAVVQAAAGWGLWRSL